MKRVLLIIFFIFLGIGTMIFSKDILRSGFPKPYNIIVSELTRNQTVDEYLVYSVMRAESRYDKNAVSYTGAKGLLQISNDTFITIKNNISLGDDVFDPETNLKAGIWYLNHLYTQLNDLEQTVKAYNCGLNNLNEKITQTEIFKGRVFEFYEIYNYLYSDRSSS